MTAIAKDRDTTTVKNRLLNESDDDEDWRVANLSSSSNESNPNPITPTRTVNSEIEQLRASFDLKVAEFESTRAKNSELRKELRSALATLDQERDGRAVLQHLFEAAQRQCEMQSQCIPGGNATENSRMSEATHALVKSLESVRQAGLDKIDALQKRVRELEDEVEDERDRVVDAISLANSLAASPNRLKRGREVWDERDIAKSVRKDTRPREHLNENLEEDDEYDEYEEDEM